MDAQSSTEMMVHSKTDWEARTFAALENITRSDLLEMLQGHSAGIRVPGLLSRQDCESAASRIRTLSKRRARQYRGGLNIGTPLDITSHWEFKYVIQREDAWFSYFRQVGATTRRRHDLFAEIGDPLDRVLHAFGKAWGAPISRLRHPRLGWRLYAGMIRSGAPRLHFDWAPFDLDVSDVVLQAGANIYLSNFSSGGDLKIYRRYGMHPGHTTTSGERIIGNYDLPYELVDGAESHTIRCGVGDFVIAPNRFLHEVTPGSGPEAERLVLSFHLALMSDGRLVVFS